MQLLLENLEVYNQYLYYLFIPVLVILFIVLIRFLLVLSSFKKEVNITSLKLNHTQTKITEMVQILSERQRRFKENLHSFIQAFAIYSFIRYVYKDYKRSKEHSLMKSLNRGIHAKVL